MLSCEWEEEAQESSENGPRKGIPWRAWEALPKPTTCHTCAKPLTCIFPPNPELNPEAGGVILGESFRPGDGDPEN